MNYARVRDNIGMGNQNVYIPENTLRGLDKYSAEIQKQIWEEAKRLAGDQKMPNTKQVQDARKKIAPKDEQNPSDMKKQFHSRALDIEVDLEKDKPADVIRKAENLTKAKAAIKEIVRRVELTQKGVYPANLDNSKSADEVLDKVIYINPAKGPRLRAVNIKIDRDGYQYDGSPLGDHWPVSVTFDVFDTATSIRAIPMNYEQADDEVYDLKGQRMQLKNRDSENSNSPKGVYIRQRNGKSPRKLIIK